MALDKGKLKDNFKEAFDRILEPAFTQALEETFSEQSAKGTKIAEQFGATIIEMISEPLAEQMASAIDAYIKNIEITTTFMSVPCSVGTPLMFNLRYMGNRTATNITGASGMGPTGQGAISVK